MPLICLFVFRVAIIVSTIILWPFLCFSFICGAIVVLTYLPKLLLLCLLICVYGRCGPYSFICTAKVVLTYMFTFFSMSGRCCVYAVSNWKVYLSPVLNVLPLLHLLFYLDLLPLLYLIYNLSANLLHITVAVRSRSRDGSVLAWRAISLYSHHASVTCKCEHDKESSNWLQQVGVKHRHPLVIACAYSLNYYPKLFDG